MLNPFYLSGPAGMVQQAAAFHRDQANDEALRRLRQSQPSLEYVAYREREAAELARILKQTR